MPNICTYYTTLYVFIRIICIIPFYLKTQMYTCMHFSCYSGWQPIFVFIILINPPSTYHVCWWKPGVSPGFFTTRALTIWRSNLLGLKRFCGLRAWHGRGAPGSWGWRPKSGIGLNMIQWVSRIQFYTILTQPKIKIRVSSPKQLTTRASQPNFGFNSPRVEGQNGYVSTKNYRYTDAVTITKGIAELKDAPNWDPAQISTLFKPD